MTTTVVSKVDELKVRILEQRLQLVESERDRWRELAEMLADEARGSSKTAPTPMGGRSRTQPADCWAPFASLSSGGLFL